MSLRFSRARDDRAFARTGEDGPYISFADLLFGIIFLFLILIAAMLITPRQSETDTQAQVQRELTQVTAENRELRATLQSLAQTNATLQHRVATIPRPVVVVPTAAPTAVPTVTAIATNDAMQPLHATIAALQQKLAAAVAAQQQSATAVAALTDANARLRARLARAGTGNGGGAAASAEVMAYNQYDCVASDCQQFIFTGAGSVYRLSDGSELLHLITRPRNVVGVSTDRPLNATDLQAEKCTVTLTHDDFVSECFSNVNGHSKVTLHRVGPMMYEGSGFAITDYGTIRHLIRRQVIQFYDDRLK